MALYANYVPNPSFELATTNWTAESGAAVTRIGSNAFSGSYSLRIQYSSSGEYGGAITTIPITPGASQAHTLSLYLSGATESHSSSYNSGIRVTVSDLLPGQTVGQRQELKTSDFSRTTNGRVSLRNFVPRATADRIVVTIRTASSYFQPQQTTTDNSGLVWATFGISGSGGITSPAGTNISATQWNNYQNTGYSVSGLTNFTYRDNFNQLSYAAKSGTWSKTTVTQPEVRGGTATVYVDAVQLEQGTTETTYVDGSKPGYVWSGAAHNSATLNMVPLQASGDTSMSGPNVEMLALAFLQSAGTLTMVGGVELTTEGTVSATGSPMSIGGDVEIWHYGPMASDGALSMAGSGELYSILSIQASGTMGPGTGLDTPSAEIRLAWDMGGSTGTPMVMGGSVEITFPQPISGDGSMSMDGTARLEIGWQLSSAGSLTLGGNAELIDAVPKGAFADFAIWSVAATDSDPLKLGRGGSNAGTLSGANGAAWNRIYAEFYAPAEQPGAWHRAQYAGIGFKFTGVPASNYQELNCVQLEASTTDASPGPRTYKTAKKITPNVWADRINYADGTLWTFIGSTGISVTDGAASPITNDAYPIRNLTISSSSAAGFFGTNIWSPPAGSLCIASIYLKGDGNIPSLKVRVLGQGFAELGASEVLPLPADEWVRFTVPFTATVDMQNLVLDIPDTILDYPAVIQAAGIMVERGTTAGEYMHFVAGTTDYYYRYNGSDKTKGAFYYRNIGERIPLLTDALTEHAPLSVLVGEPEFGLIPSLD